MQKNPATLQVKLLTRALQANGCIPLLDSLINQLEERFEGEGRHSHILLCLIPCLVRVVVSNSLSN